MIRISSLLCILSLTLFSTALSQSVVGSQKVKKFPTEAPWVYPYETLDLAGRKVYLAHQTAAVVGPGEFVHLWRPQRTSGRKRVLIKYNLLMEELWKTEFELAREEIILHLHQDGDQMMMLTTEYDYAARRHYAWRHSFELDSGSMGTKTLIMQVAGRENQELFFAQSPDSNHLMLYYFEAEKPHHRVRIFYDAIRQDESAGYKISAAARLQFVRFDQAWERQDEGSIELPTKKITTLDCQIDQAGNVYTVSFYKPHQLQVRQFNVDTRQQTVLKLDDFCDFKDLTDPYEVLLPASVDQLGRVLIARSDRKLRGPQRGVHAFEVVAFDFRTEEVSLKRRGEITSTLLVQVEKQRKRLNLRPLKRFDEFVLRQLFPMPDGSQWLGVQKCTSRNYSRINHQTPFELANEEVEIGELILFHYNPEGDLDQAIIVPGIQRVNTYYERLGQFSHLFMDRNQQELRLVMREPSRENFRGPDRLYYRSVSLSNGYISPRMQIYEGKRRNQFFLKPYTLWLNRDLLSLMMIDGEDGDAYVVSINLTGEGEIQE